MNKRTKFLLGTTLLCMSQMAFADCEDPDAPDDCVVVYGDDNDSVDHSSGGGSGGSVSTDGGSQQSDSANNSGGNGGGNALGFTSTMTKEQCYARTDTIHSGCETRAYDAHTFFLEEECGGENNSSINAGHPVLNYNSGGQDYTKCKDRADSTRAGDLSRCNNEKYRYREICASIKES